MKAAITLEGLSILCTFKLETQKTIRTHASAYIVSSFDLEIASITFPTFIFFSQVCVCELGVIKMILGILNSKQFLFSDFSLMETVTK